MTINQKAIYLLSAGLLFLMLVPFLLLAWYNNPSVDDYAFVYYTKTMGLFGAQVMWYTQWTGRYSGMFLMSIHPLVFDSLLLYKVISFFFILISWHALYAFAWHVLQVKTKTAAVVLSLIAFLVFLNGMPSLVQGFYWEAGAVTYQLGNVLTLYFIVLIFKAHQFENANIGRKWFAASGIIIFAVCGLSETVMLAIDLVVGYLFLWALYRLRKPALHTTVYAVVGLVCSAVVFFAPGNALRGDSSDLGNISGNGAVSIRMSFEAGLTHIGQWLQFPELWVLTFALVAMQVKFRSNRMKRAEWIGIAFIAILGFGLVSATFTPGFYATGMLPPERVVNVSFWTFLIVWMGFIAALTTRISYEPKATFKQVGIVILVGVVLLPITARQSGNGYAAVSDIISGRASRHNAEFAARESQVASCQTDTCKINTFTVFPKSVFNEDLANHESHLHIGWYAHYHEKQAIKGVFSTPEAGFYRHFDFEGQATDYLGNQESISERNAFSGQRSSFVKAGQGYSASFNIKMKDMYVPNIYFLGRIQIKAKVYITGVNCDADLVFVINGPMSPGPLVWRGTPVACDSSKAGGWQEIKMLIPLEKRLIHPDHEVMVYLWNHGAAELYMDDLDIWIY